MRLAAVAQSAFLVAALTAASGGAGAGCREASAENDAVSNIRLGMAPRDVRDRFQPGREGTWQTALGAGDDTVLEWTAKAANAKSGIAQSRFEFHLAMLVAIRARTNDPPPERDQISTTPRTVTLRGRAAEGGTTILVLARDCPTHKEEAESLASKARGAAP